MDAVMLLAKALGWDPSKLEIEPIAAGLTNKNYRLSMGDKEFFFRLPGPSTDLLAVDRENELHNTRAAARAGVGPKVLQHDAKTGGMLLEWLPGRTMSNEAFQAPGMPARIAEALRRLHAGPRFRDDFNMFRLTEYYLRVVDERSIRIPDGYRDELPKVARIEAALAARPLPTVPCHNDLLAENYLDDGARCGSSTTSTAATTTRRSSSATPPRSSASTPRARRSSAPRTSGRSDSRGRDRRCSPGCGCR